MKISISLRRGVTPDRGLGPSARGTTFDRICATQHYPVPEAKALGSRPRDPLCASVAHQSKVEVGVCLAVILFTFLLCFPSPFSAGLDGSCPYSYAQIYVSDLTFALVR